LIERPGKCDQGHAGESRGKRESNQHHGLWSGPSRGVKRHGTRAGSEPKVGIDGDKEVANGNWQLAIGSAKAPLSSVAATGLCWVNCQLPFANWPPQLPSGNQFDTPSRFGTVLRSAFPHSCN